MKILPPVAASDSDLFPPRRGKIEMGLLKQNLRSPLPYLPRQGEGIKSALSLRFLPRLAPTIFKGAHGSTKLTTGCDTKVSDTSPRIRQRTDQPQLLRLRRGVRGGEGV